ncbi:uncharacterized protein LOC134788208 [Penaeus indicus]|uniref:uncharacterized protein LOC134788208 n=1 Tax=Penaeus indicus TaxID=29960 RepID=UPI00300CD9CF
MVPRCNGGLLVILAVVGAALLNEVSSLGRNGRPRVDLNARKEYYRQRLTDGCIQRPPPPNPPPLPTVPNSFITDLEIAFQQEDQQRILYGKEMYDGVVKRGVLDYRLTAGIVLTRPYLLSEVIHYNVPIDEALFVLTNEGCSVTGQENCDTTKLCIAKKIKDVSLELQELFGFVAVAGESGFMGATGILEFGPQFNYTAMELVQDCHGIDCDVFETCLDKPEEGVSVMYTYYWSNKEWNLQNNKEPVPIAVEIYANGAVAGHTDGEIMVRYDFFDFRREFRPSRYVLEPPQDVYCTDRKTYLSPPKTVQSFSYKSEHITGVDIPFPSGDNDTFLLRFRGIFPKDEWYDWDTRITRMDYTPFYVIRNERRFENFTRRIHDFNQGLAYIIKPRLNFCNITKIENVTSWGDVMVGEDGSVFMQSPWNYEDLDEPMQYNGVHWERGLETDVWVGVKKNPHLGIKENYVWYFASPLTNEILGRQGPKLPSFQTLDKVPVKLEKYISLMEGLPHVIYNIYDYNSEVPHTHKHDVSLCFSPSQMRHFKFDLPANSLNKTFYLRENVKYATMQTLAEAAKVTPIRINRLEINETSAALEVTFTVLEKPSIVGDVPGAGMDSSMDEAVELIRATLDSSQLVVQVKISVGIGGLVSAWLLTRIYNTKICLYISVNPSSHLCSSLSR